MNKSGSFPARTRSRLPPLHGHNWQGPRKGGFHAKAQRRSAKDAKKIFFSGLTQGAGAYRQALGRARARVQRFGETYSLSFNAYVTGRQADMEYVSPAGSSTERGNRITRSCRCVRPVSVFSCSSRNAPHPRQGSCSASGLPSCGLLQVPVSVFRMHFPP